MARLAIISSRAGLRPLIEQLYHLQVAHLVEFSEGARPELAEFRIGKPLPEGQQASDRLVRLRGLQRHLDLGEHRPAARSSARDIERDLDDAIHQLELNITSAAEARQRIQQSLEGIAKERAVLEPLKPLHLRIEDYGGYESLAVLVGRADEPAAVERAVRAASSDADVFTAEGTAAFAVFAPKSQAGKAAEAVARAQGQLAEAPHGKGEVKDRLEALDGEEKGLRSRLAQATGELARLRRQHADFLVAAEEHLAIQAEKAEAPLGFATSEHAFVAECWVPEDRVEEVRAALRGALGDNFHLDVEHPGARGPRAPAAPAEGAEAGDRHEGAEDGEQRGDVPPTKLDLKGPFRHFQFFTEMVSVPRHDEIDPTPILAIVLPLFLGFMIGDLGYGVLMLVLGVYMLRKLGARFAEARDIGFALALAGVISAIFGGVVFTDALGIPIGMHEAGLTCQQFVAEAKETTWGCITGIGSLNSVHPVVAKLRDIGDLLILSVLAAFVHMTLGLGFGVVNTWAHSKKHALAKVGWFVLMVGFFVQILYMAGPGQDLAGTPQAEGNRIAIAVYQGLHLPQGGSAVVGPVASALHVPFHWFLLGGMVLSAVLLAVGEGPITVMELPTMLSNLMSYTRLAGLAIAKGAMAAAFTSLTLVAMVVGGPGGAVGLVLALVGLVLFILTQAFVFVLGVFSSSIQAIRLNYVEFFNKFYEGGGIRFTPFGKTRKYTQEA
jgi:V/A-type H+-transporting ATPase subunit I